ncbi:hypothetical protein [Dellaglioa carnosa]|uniref:Zinc ribbon domain-containing protein n=1 Tax=Dellaglioa carnosa TaxID=2995136 RepID=A0ABT4JL71_9LACO|nr:hypothetical protein [Dellaglioa carnosa]MCZ2490830.1 hypothetical protein [Dellaglioa carnosa]MCZ2493908.1 hypothetical protein [Dellaglioa carnosa]MDK1730772.1 hypothetical protein [Dellaglioa carnosa]
MTDTYSEQSDYDGFSKIGKSHFDNGETNIQCPFCKGHLEGERFCKSCGRKIFYNGEPEFESLFLPSVKKFYVENSSFTKVGNSLSKTGDSLSSAGSAITGCGCLIIGIIILFFLLAII